MYGSAVVQDLQAKRMSGLELSEPGQAEEQAAEA